MAELTDDATNIAVLSEQASAMLDPFAGDCQRFAWPREVQIGQLQVEVTEALGEAVRLVVVPSAAEEGGLLPVDAQNPLVVFVTPASADLGAVRRIMAAHVPDPYFGLSDADRQRMQLREKVRQGGDLSMAEMQEAMRMLLS
ncbi:hypothetical protein [Streptomyces sp. NPDC059761]|uniref:hypothetical protein n=1 Tax=Streptomyces sp. NPDC059761 TaxID=3346937 RepID=UPI0036535D5E